MRVPGSTTLRGSSRSLRWLLVAALAGATVLAVVRGAWPALGHGNDLAMMYTAARSWLLGADPYDLATQLDVFEEAAGTRRDRLAPSLNPPVTFPVLAPIAAMPWPTARATVVLVNVGLTVVLLLGLLRLAGIEAGSTAGLLFLAIAAAFAPLHTGLRLGQTSIAATACIAGSIAAVRRNRSTSAGVLLALAVALKPQIAVLFVVFHACRGRWRLVAAAATTLVALGAAGVGWLYVRDVEWLPSLLANARATFADGGIGATTAANPLRFQLINLPYPLGMLIVSEAVVRFIVLAAVGAMLVVAVLRDRRAHGGHAALEAYAIVSALALMVTYHRTYDAVILYLPLLAAIAAARAGRQARATVVIVLVGCFLLPVSSILHRLATSGMVPVAITDRWWWEMILMPLQAWAVVALAIALCLPQRSTRAAVEARGSPLYCPP